MKHSGGLDRDLSLSLYGLDSVVRFIGRSHLVDRDWDRVIQRPITVVETYRIAYCVHRDVSCAADGSHVLMRRDFLYFKSVCMIY